MFIEFFFFLSSAFQSKLYKTVDQAKIQSIIYTIHHHRQTLYVCLVKMCRRSALNLPKYILK